MDQNNQSETRTENKTENQKTNASLKDKVTESKNGIEAVPVEKAEESTVAETETVISNLPMRREFYEETETSSLQEIGSRRAGDPWDHWLWVVFALLFFLLFAGIIVFRVLKIKKGKKRMDFYRTESPYGSPNDVVKMLEIHKKAPVAIGRIHGIGRREMQQDSFGLSELDRRILIEEKGVLAIVADGMGGLEDGDRISQLVVVTMLQGFDKSSEDDDPAEVLMKLLDEANEAVNNELGDDKLGQSGSTLVAALVKKGRLYYISVGDSHLYLYRNGRLVQLNKDHNYGAELDEMAKNGEISLEEAANNPKRAALTSYLGMGDIEYVDRNEKPYALESGDRILLMSDGIYGTVGDVNLCNAMNGSLRRSCLMINEIINAENKPNQDNYTCVIMEWK